MSLAIDVKNDNCYEEIYVKTYTCPNPDCKRSDGGYPIMEGMKYCPNCGRKTVWVEVTNGA